jgi:hypothetical protein
MAGRTAKGRSGSGGNTAGQGRRQRQAVVGQQVVGGAGAPGAGFVGMRRQLLKAASSINSINGVYRRQAASTSNT